MPLTYSPTKIHEREGNLRGSELLEKVGLGERMHHEPSQMSGGQQQRVAIARSLVNRPPLLLADEPTGNLDSRTSEEILRMFQDLNAAGITIIIVTHDLPVAQHAQRIIRIRDGRIEDDGTAASGNGSRLDVGPTGAENRRTTCRVRGTADDRLRIGGRAHSLAMAAHHRGRCLDALRRRAGVAVAPRTRYGRVGRRRIGLAGFRHIMCCREPFRSPSRH